MELGAGPYAGVARELAGTRFAEIVYAEETASTNADAAVLLDDARYAGRTIVAEYQRQGAGRKGRSWTAPAGSGLLFTTILPRAVDTEKLWLVPYWAGLAVRAALREFGVTTTLAWPNDLLLRESKLAGVLCQTCVIGPTSRVACGVGINVLRPGIDPEIEPPPAFCDDVTTVERSALLRAVLREYDRTLSRLDQPELVIAEWDDGAQLPRRYRIALDGETTPFEAIAEGLASGGGLRVVRHNGVRETIALADARVVR